MESARLNQIQSEYRLTVIHFICACLSAVSLVTTAVVFGYWHDTLNICQPRPDYDVQKELRYDMYDDSKPCGCLLYATSTYKVFIGGKTSICHFVEFSNIPGIVIGTFLGITHWYRVSFVLKKQPKSRRRRRPIVTRLNANDEVHAVIEPIPPSTSATVTWLSCGIVVMLLALLSFTAAVFLTDGTMKACREFRQNIIEFIHADGNMAVLIKERLFCNAVFDFMDYLQPIRYRNSANFINSGAALYVALFAMWFAAIGWVMATVISIYEAFRYRIFNNNDDH